MCYLVLLEPLRSHLLGLHSRALELTGLEGMHLQGHRIPLERMEYNSRRKIRLKEVNTKCRHLKRLTCKGTLWQGFICLRPPPL
jgi:hypothetical protein